MREQNEDGTLEPIKSQKAPKVGAPGGGGCGAEDGSLEGVAARAQEARGRTHFIFLVRRPVGLGG